MENTLVENTKCFIHRKHKCCIDGKYINGKHKIFIHRKHKCCIDGKYINGKTQNVLFIGNTNVALMENTLMENMEVGEG
jgi:hypothetical protein